MTNEQRAHDMAVAYAKTFLEQSSRRSDLSDMSALNYFSEKYDLAYREFLSVLEHDD
ncbi:hypothetical protein LNP00_02945 [Fructobacillus sp. M158]|uniref:hypothetical protein n=1 Tax=Fructobacillus parabroussonetiae TaxID=2713174 RepID=UPI00200ADC4F|nr:hypothetical protein [Fructobacillus parabroussonetiae]MCK8617328.1 hypothetical protein [Fructobacillus parabroussonetiae]